MTTTKEILEEMIATHEARTAEYGNSKNLAGPVLAALFPAGMLLRTIDDHEMWNLFNLLMAKLLRFVASDLQHADSIHDLAVYAAMIETILQNRKGV